MWMTPACTTLNSNGSVRTNVPWQRALNERKVAKNWQTVPSQSSPIAPRRAWSAFASHNRLLRSNRAPCLEEAATRAMHCRNRYRGSALKRQKSSTKTLKNLSRSNSQNQRLKAPKKPSNPKIHPAKTHRERLLSTTTRFKPSLNV